MFHMKPPLNSIAGTKRLLTDHIMEYRKFTSCTVNSQGDKAGKELQFDETTQFIE